MCATINIPADNNAVVKQVNFNVLDADGLVEALRDEQPQQPPQVGRVVKRHPHLRGESLQQWQQHGPRVNLPCTLKKKKKRHRPQSTIRVRRMNVVEKQQEERNVTDLLSRVCSQATRTLLGCECFPASVVELLPYSPPETQGHDSTLNHE